MTALDDAIAKADEVLALGAPALTRDQVLRHAAIAPDLARALKAVAEALDEAEARVPPVERQGRFSHGVLCVIADIRAAIERRLTEGK